MLGFIPLWNQVAVSFSGLQCCFATFFTWKRSRCIFFCLVWTMYLCFVNFCVLNACLASGNLIGSLSMVGVHSTIDMERKLTIDVLMEMWELQTWLGRTSLLKSFFFQAAFVFSSDTGTWSTWLRVKFISLLLLTFERDDCTWYQSRDRSTMISVIWI